MRTTIEGIRDSFIGGGALPAELQTAFDDLFSVLNAALSPVGMTVVALDDSATATPLEACSAELTGALSGTFAAADGSCAAAATRGVGVGLTLPAELAGALGIAGPWSSCRSCPRRPSPACSPWRRP